MKMVCELFKEVGIVPDMHVGKPKTFFDIDTEEGQLHTLEWFMGALMILEKEGAYSSLNDWVKHIPKYTTFKTGGSVINYIN